jgi:hypothetical protein
MAERSLGSAGCARGRLEEKRPRRRTPWIRNDKGFEAIDEAGLVRSEVAEERLVDTLIGETLGELVETEPLQSEP